MYHPEMIIYIYTHLDIFNYMGHFNLYFAAP